MPHGTANGKLRKMLLFYFVKKLNIDICYRCKKRIVKLKDFSVDHKKSWMYADNPIEAFFDIENIAFSHIKCNIGGAKRPTKIYRNAKERKRENGRRYRAKRKKTLELSKRRK